MTISTPFSYFLCLIITLCQVDLIMLSKSTKTTFKWEKIKTAENNINYRDTIKHQNLHNNIGDAAYISYKPGDAVPPFTLPTLGGDITYPGPVINHTTPVLFHAFHPDSGFCQCLWNCTNSLEDFITTVPSGSHLVVLSYSEDAYSDVLWMRNRFNEALYTLILNQKVLKEEVSSLSSRIHYVTVGVSYLGNWMPVLLRQWYCLDHNCGLDQVALNSPKIQSSLHHPLILKRLDSRYDWLPSPGSKFGDKTITVKYAGNGCSSSSSVKGVVAAVTDTGCSYFQKVHNMQASGAVGVIVIDQSKKGLQDMNCEGSECNTQLNIPATMVDYTDFWKMDTNLTVKFQNTPSETFFFAMDQNGTLAEVGWFLYPSLQFLAWQGQWFQFKGELTSNLSKPALVYNLLNHTVMHGSGGASVMMTIPIDKLAEYSKFEVDMSLSCPGDRDSDCAHWDHTASLHASCMYSEYSDIELTRWITPFRRRIGRWLTDITPLFPLLVDQPCTFTMKTAAWAMPWLPSLNFRFSGQRNTGDLYPIQVQPLYSPQFTFDKNYNTNFKPVTFDITHTTGIKKVEIYSVITGHGSDENGCGEFCVTSHHFTVNNHTDSITFSNAGTPLGCAHRVLEGVEPNEHGTWLYGRDGWCDGQDVKPWIIDVTKYLVPEGDNILSYKGYFNGKDPDPKSNPGVMIFWSYLVMYGEYVADFDDE